jgi:hypothetical protein
MILHTDTEWPPRRCSGESCRQGRAECKTPEACQLPEPRNAGVVPRGSSLLKLAVLLGAACAVFVAVLA